MSSHLGYNPECNGSPRKANVIRWKPPFLRLEMLDGRERLIWDVWASTSHVQKAFVRYPDNWHSGSFPRLDTINGVFKNETFAPLLSLSLGALLRNTHCLAQDTCSMQEDIRIRLPRSFSCDIISADDVALKAVEEIFEILGLAIKVPSRGSSGDYDWHVVFHQVLDQPLYSREEPHGWPLRI